MKVSRLRIKVGKCKKCGTNLSIGGMQQPWCSNCEPEKSPTNPNKKLKVSKKTQKELREKWNENVVTCIGCGIQWAKPGKQCPVCYTPIVELGRNVEVSKNWQKDFDKKFQYALDDGFYVIEEQALKQFIKDLLEKEEKELVGKIEKELEEKYQKNKHIPSGIPKASLSRSHYYERHQGFLSALLIVKDILNSLKKGNK